MVILNNTPATAEGQHIVIRLRWHNKPDEIVVESQPGDKPGIIVGTKISSELPQTMGDFYPGQINVTVVK